VEVRPHVSVEEKPSQLDLVNAFLAVLPDDVVDEIAEAARAKGSIASHAYASA